MTSPNSEKFTFGLVHGSWHGAWCWEYLQNELESGGHKTIAIELPVEDVNATYDTYADVVADALSGETDPVLVGHSRAGNVIPRVVGKIAVKKLIFLCSSLEYSTLHGYGYEENTSLPLRNPPEYHHGIRWDSDNHTIYDEELAKYYFYHDCNPEQQQWAVKHMRPQRKPVTEPALSSRPAVPHAYIVATEDRIIRPEWSRHIARKYLGVEPVSIESGHSPFLSVPVELAKQIIEISNDEDDIITQYTSEKMGQKK